MSTQRLFIQACQTFEFVRYTQSYVMYTQSFVDILLFLHEALITLACMICQVFLGNVILCVLVQQEQALTEYIASPSSLISKQPTLLITAGLNQDSAVAKLLVIIMTCICNSNILGALVLYTSLNMHNAKNPQILANIPQQKSIQPIGLNSIFGTLNLDIHWFRSLRLDIHEFIS